MAGTLVGKSKKYLIFGLYYPKKYLNVFKIPPPPKKKIPENIAVAQENP